jgi:ribonuclease HII
MDCFIAGVDEAGRGPLAGPVYAAAVILNPNRPIDGLKDSKKLSEEKRDDLFKKIRQFALAWSVASASVDEIDDVNILQATFLAMQRAVEKLKILPGLILVDGNHAPIFPFPSKAIIGGDDSEPAISAASIMAKVSRDKYMRNLHEQYPQYNFAQHKGYGTEEHLQLIQKHGPHDTIHRKSFAPIAAYYREANKEIA